MTLFYRRIPIVGRFLKSDSRLDIHSPAQLKKTQEEYRGYLGFGKDVDFSKDAFSTLANARRDSVDLFVNKLSDGTTLADKLKGNSADVQTLRAKLNKALEPTQNFSKAETEYTESVATFKQLTEKVPQELKADALIGTMTNIKNDARHAILQQQRHEKEAIKAVVDDLDLRPKFSAVLGLNTPAEFDKFKTAMIGELEKEHAKDLEAFDKSTTESLKKIHTAQAKEHNQFLFIANLHQTNDEMRQKIEALAAAARDPNANSQVAINVDAKKASISGVTLESLGDIKSIAGGEIQRQPDGSYSLKFSRRIASPKYYLDPRQNVKADLLLMAQAVKATGAKSIKMNLSFDDPKTANDRARQAYEACIKTGYPKDKISIVVNGQVYKETADKKKDIKPISELFKDHQHEHRNLKEVSSTIIKDLAPLNASEEKIKQEIDKPSTSPESIAQVKAAIQTLRTAAQNSAQQEVNPGPEQGSAAPAA